MASYALALRVYMLRGPAHVTTLFDATRSDALLGCLGSHVPAGCVCLRVSACSWEARRIIQRLMGSSRGSFAATLILVTPNFAHYFNNTMGKGSLRAHAARVWHLGGPPHAVAHCTNTCCKCGLFTMHASGICHSIAFTRLHARKQECRHLLERSGHTPHPGVPS